MSVMWIDDYDANDAIDPTPFAAIGEDICGQTTEDDCGLSYTCDREPGHNGRCMSLTFEDGDTPFVHAAWPGDHAPCEEDL